VPRVYDDFDEGDTRLDPSALIGGVPTDVRRIGGTVLMPAAIATGKRPAFPAPSVAPYPPISGNVRVAVPAEIAPVAPVVAPARVSVTPPFQTARASRRPGAVWRPTVLEIVVGVVAGVLTAVAMLVVVFVIL
jgi:hypothetical protein